jgi:hypothetical protein
MFLLRKPAETQALNESMNKLCDGISSDKRFCKTYGISGVMAGMHMDNFTSLRVFTKLADRIFIEVQHKSLLDMPEYALDMAKADIAYKLASGIR